MSSHQGDVQMSQVRFLPSALFLFFACGTGCQSFSSQDVPARVAAAVALSPGKRSVGKSPRFSPAPLRVGHEVTYLINGQSPDAALYTLKVEKIGDLPHSYWFREEWVQAGREEAVSLLVGLESSRLVVAQTEPNYQVTLADFGRPLQSPEMQSPMWPLLQLRFFPFGNASLFKARKVSVRAGQFKGCYDAKGTQFVSLLGEPLREEPYSGCFDSKVPLFGLVEGQDGRGRRWELVDFSFEDR
jgi:hypothetical protein